MAAILVKLFQKRSFENCGNCGTDDEGQTDNLPDASSQLTGDKVFGQSKVSPNLIYTFFSNLKL